MTAPANRHNRARGASFEREVATFLGVDRAYGAGRPRDVGDLAGVQGTVVECKRERRLDLAGWVDEAEAERRNAGASLAVVVSKRRGTTEPGSQYAILTLDGLRLLLAEAGRL